MLRATGLVRRFAGVTALDGVALAASKGEVLGFLGPNGAGKTTTMRILAGFLAPDSGRVEVCGIDLARESRRARARIGYLPEGVALHPDMRIGEWLGFRAGLKGVVRRERRAQVEGAAARVGLAGELRRMIGTLSKGYRQRVGLADALLGAPEVLILDEPTDGLDPNQRREVLELIRELGRERAVVLSTHVLPEVERVCGRVIILDRGKVVAEGKPAELQRAHDLLRVEARAPRAALLAALRAIDGVTAVELDGPHPVAGDAGATGTGADGEGGEHEIVRLRVRSARDLREAVAEAVHTVGKLRMLAPSASGLEALFAKLTERA